MRASNLAKEELEVRLVNEIKRADKECARRSSAEETTNACIKELEENRAEIAKAEDADAMMQERDRYGSALRDLQQKSSEREATMQQMSKDIETHVDSERALREELEEEHNTNQSLASELADLEAASAQSTSKAAALQQEIKQLRVHSRASGHACERAESRVRAITGNMG